MEFKAYYGLSTSSTDFENVVDVTDFVKANFYSDGIIIIPANTDLQKIFAASVSNLPNDRDKYLQIVYGDRKINILDEIYSEDLKFDTSNSISKVKNIVVYYIYINENSNWRGIISGQLLQLKNYGLFDESDTYIHITDIGNNLDEAKKLVHELVPLAVISTSVVNQFEYPAIKLVYELAQINADAIIMYFHVKGMSYNVHSRIPDEMTLLTYTFKNWRKNIHTLRSIDANKLGLFASPGDVENPDEPGARRGWIWFNFWYAKASYLRNCDEPIITPNRYYYESWLGHHKSKLDIRNDCYSLFTRKYRKRYTFKTRYSKIFTQHEAWESLNTLKYAVVNNDFYRY